MPRAEQAAVIFTGMNVFQKLSQRVDRSRNAFLLNIGVKRIDGYANARMAYSITQSLPISGSIQEECFRTVHRLDRKRDIMRDKRIAHRLKTFNRPVPFIVGAAPAWKITDGRIERTADQARARFGCS